MTLDPPGTRTTLYPEPQYQATRSFVLNLPTGQVRILEEGEQAPEGLTAAALARHVRSGDLVDVNSTGDTSRAQQANEILHTDQAQAEAAARTEQRLQEARQETAELRQQRSEARARARADAAASAPAGQDRAATKSTTGRRSA